MARTSGKNPSKSKKTMEEHRVIDFLKFPPEIRNNIYDIIFVKPTYIGFKAAGVAVQTNTFYKDAAKWRNMAFAISCRQVYDESANIFYANNGFEFFYIRPLHEFLEAIGITKRLLITKLRVHIISESRKGRAAFLALRYLGSCQALQSLEIFGRYLDNGLFSWEFPLKNAKNFFIDGYDEVEFGEAQQFGLDLDTNESPPKLSPNDTQVAIQFSFTGLRSALNRVKQESGTPKRK